MNMILKEFDIIAVKKTRSIWGKIAQFFCKDYSHVALVVNDWQVIETNLSKPVGISPLGNQLGEFDVFRYKYPITTTQRELIIEFLQKNLNNKYDIIEAITIPFRYNRYNERRFICISLITEAFRYAGIELPQITGFKSISECDLFEKIIT